MFLTKEGRKSEAHLEIVTITLNMIRYQLFRHEGYVEMPLEHRRGPVFKTTRPVLAASSEIPSPLEYELGMPYSSALALRLLLTQVSPSTH